VPDAINNSAGQRSFKMKKIYLRNIVMNYTVIKRDRFNDLIFEEIEKKYPIGYIEVKTGLIFGINHFNLPESKSINAEFFHYHFQYEISMNEFCKERRLLQNTEKNNDLKKFEALLELRHFIKTNPNKFQSVQPEIFNDIKANSEVLNRIIGIPGYRYAKLLGWMKVVKEIKKQLNY
jgi:hypothetical protein